MTPSSREAQAEIRNATAKSETAHDAKRGIIGTNLTSDTFDASCGVLFGFSDAAFPFSPLCRQLASLHYGGSQSLGAEHSD
jgi:hypothetical protein